MDVQETEVELETVSAGRRSKRVKGNTVDRAIGGLVRLETQRRRKRLLKMIGATIIAVSLIVGVYQALRISAGIDLIDRLTTLVQAKLGD